MDKSLQRLNYLVIGLSTGLAMGVALGAALENLVIGMALGLFVGLSVGTTAIALNVILEKKVSGGYRKQVGQRSNECIQ